MQGLSKPIKRIGYAAATAFSVVLIFDLITAVDGLPSSALGAGDVVMFEEAVNLREGITVMPSYIKASVDETANRLRVSCHFDDATVESSHHLSALYKHTAPYQINTRVIDGFWESMNNPYEYMIYLSVGERDYEDKFTKYADLSLLDDDFYKGAMINLVNCNERLRLVKRLAVAPSKKTYL